jgi:hypothetical protein
MREKIGGEGETLAHQICRNQAEMLAGASNSDKKSFRTGDGSGEEEKRSEGGDWGAL